ncbi:MAG: GNAT family N-acetyltransferase [Chloroflexi bacterium]|nr:GNAT family N-acetyltransferase [Chloroflexota bacterium]
MTDGAMERCESRLASGYRVVREANARILESRLSDDRPLAAYALGHLEPELIERAEFWTADGPAGSATVMHARALGLVTVTIGDPEAVGTILALHPGHRLGYLTTGSPDHIAVIARTHEVEDTLPIQRMSVSPLTFQDADGEVRRLWGRDASRINALYSTEGSSTRYPADVIERAIYYGTFDGDRLTSVAGTHIVSSHQSIAVVGNVFTHPGYRGRGLATRVTGAVTREILNRGCSEVVLTVAPENAPAVAAYTRLGYRQGSPVVEARLQRRDLAGVGPGWRRFIARRRGRSIGNDVEWVRARRSEDTT